MPIKEQKEKLLQVVKDALQKDTELREKHHVGGKFRFIHERLQSLVTQVEEGLAVLHEQAKRSEVQVGEDEIIVHVYLYNAQGLVMQTWQKMLNPSVFYEHSVNRPIYLEQKEVEAFIRAKPNKVQHGYLSVVVKKQDVLPVTEAGQAKDALGNVLMKVKEGSLRFNKLIAFTQGDHVYRVNEVGELIKK